MISNMLLALGLLLSPATQLRSGDLPIGPGEICLAIWVAIQLAREAVRLGPPMTPALNRLLMFWILFAAAQSIGTIVGLGIELIPDPVSARHDTIAYLLAAAVSCLAINLSDAEKRLRHVAWIIAILGNLLLAVQLGQGLGLVSAWGTDPYEWDRFRGWSENSNALALLCVAVAVLPLYVAETATRTAPRILAWGLCILPLYVGVLTKSDSFTLFLVTAGPLLVLLKLWTWIRSIDRQLTYRGAFAGLSLLVLPLILAGAASAVATADVSIGRAVTEVYEDNHQGDERLKLWREAWRRGINSGMLGLGPGAHILDSKFKRQPPPNFEAHNTFLDLFTQGGLLSIVVFLWLTATAFLAAVRAHVVSLSALLCGLLVFGMFHLIVRHPIFWFCIVLCLVAGGSGALQNVQHESQVRHA
jgi:hypothetical protein